MIDIHHTMSGTVFQGAHDVASDTTVPPAIVGVWNTCRRGTVCLLGCKMLVPGKATDLHVLNGVDALGITGLLLELIDQLLYGRPNVPKVGIHVLAEELILAVAQHSFLEIFLYLHSLNTISKPAMDRAAILVLCFWA